jgi:hypothetical protein
MSAGSSASQPNSRGSQAPPSLLRLLGAFPIGFSVDQHFVETVIGRHHRYLLSELVGQGAAGRFLGEGDEHLSGEARLSRIATRRGSGAAAFLLGKRLWLSTAALRNVTLSAHGTNDRWPHDVDDTEKGKNYAAALDMLYRRHRARSAGRHVYADDGFGTLLLLQASPPSPPPPSSLLVA